MRTICIANQKGGVSKTTTTAALGSIIAGAGQRVLLVDIDPQASLSQSLGVESPGRSMGEVMGANKPGKLSMAAVICHVRPGLDLAPADLSLSLTESGLVLRYGRERVLKEALDQVRELYDLVLIDCPPTLSALFINAIGAADALIIPTLPAPNDLRGLKMFLNTLEEVRPINPGLEVLGILVSQFQQVNSHRRALAALQRLGIHVLQPPIPKSVKVQESQAVRKLLDEYDPGGKPTEAYKQIAKGIIQWLQRDNQPMMITT